MCELKTEDLMLIDALVGRSIKALATQLGKDPQYIYNKLYRLRQRWKKAQRFHNQMLGIIKRNPHLAKYLKPR